MADVKLLNNIFSDCGKDYKHVSLGGLRIGYPKNFWEDLGEEVDSHLIVTTGCTSIMRLLLLTMSAMLRMLCLPFQTIGAFDSALEALKSAGVELVDMDMSLLVDLGKKNVPDHIFYLYEMPREISRHAYNPPGRHMSWP